MRRNSRTLFGSASSRKTLTGSCEAGETQHGPTKTADAPGDTQVADCGNRFYRALIARGVPRPTALATSRRVVRLAASDLPREIAEHQARRLTRQALTHARRAA